MGRKSTIPTFTSFPAMRRALLAGDPASVCSRDRKSGGEWHYLTDHLHSLDPRCVVCDLPTLRTGWDGAMTATLGLLIPSAMVRAAFLARADKDEDAADMLDEMRDRGVRLSRLGYVKGNLALMCGACVNASNAHRASTGESVVLDPRTISGGSRVTSEWPTLRRVSAPPVPTRDEVRALVTMAPAHAARARSARAASGLPY